MLSLQPGAGQIVRSSTGPMAQYRLEAPLPPGAGGQWCRVRLRLPARTGWWARLELIDPARAQIVRGCFLGRLRARPGGSAERATLVHVPANAQSLTLYIYGPAQGMAPGEGAAFVAENTVPRIEILSRATTTSMLLWQGRRLIGFALSGKAQGRFGRLRALLGQAPARAGEAPPYAVWIALCEPALPPPPAAPQPALQIAITGAHSAARTATLASLRAQAPAAAALFVSSPQDWRRLSAPWVVILQAGEILAPQALAWFAHAVSANPHAAFITADCDELDAHGARSNPLLKPGPGALLLRGALVTQGACAVRWPAAPPDLPADGNAARHILGENRAGGVAHIPRILTHIGAPASLIAAAAPPPPCRDPDFLPRVTALIPTALRSAHVTSCLRGIMRHTAYPAFRVRLVLSDPGHAKPRLRRMAECLPGVQVSDIPQHPFNYAAVNNAAAAEYGGENPDDLLLLMNDDVEPLNAAWLDAMVAHMQDPTVGIVGARLLYGNGMVQHEGVIMGLAHLCEHAGRLRPGNQPGPHGIGLLDRDVSAVTAACLLIRAGLFRALAGMDTGFAIALNDVDLCLRARQAGWRVVYCAHATLYHYESLSLGRHYAGGRAVLEAVEVRRLRDRWGGVIGADPFYNPLASLEPGREWLPAFAPRATACPVGTPNPAANPSQKQ